MTDPTILPDPTCLHLLQLEAEGKVITATVKTTALEVRCPLCESRSMQVHSHYRRVLADYPGWGVRCGSCSMSGVSSVRIPTVSARSLPNACPA